MDGMICVTGAEPDPAALATRLAALPEADLQELRLDKLADPAAFRPAELPAPERWVVTCRLASEGGDWRGDEAARLALFEAALAAGARFVDLEAAAPEASWQRLAAVAGPQRLVASWHDFSGAPAPDKLAAGLAQLAARPAGYLKLAVGLSDVVELAALAALEVPDGRPLVRLGMGCAGLLTRYLPECFGSPWTYAAAPSSIATAPGQPGWEELAAARRRHADQLLVLLGGPQVEGSPGPHVYNGLAAASGRPWLYLPAPTVDPWKALEVLADWGLRGASVTMPHKTILANPPTALLGDAAVLGVVNTLVTDGSGGWCGNSTDGVGVTGALGKQLPAAGAPVVVLGAGGAARAAASALQTVGLVVTVMARRAEAARALAAELGAKWAPRESLAGGDFAVLINATPLGAAGEQAVPETVDWRGKVVLDMILAPRFTPLLEGVRAGGGVALPGLLMWIHQGAAQWALLTGETVAPEALAAQLAPEHRAGLGEHVP